MDATLNLESVSLTNEASTIVTDNLAATARLRARLSDADTGLELQLTGKQGQILVNPVLLDLGKNPLVLESQAKLKAPCSLHPSGCATKQDSLIGLSANLKGDKLGKDVCIKSKIKISIRRLGYFFVGRVWRHLDFYRRSHCRG